MTNYLAAIADKITFDIYYIKLCNTDEPVIRTKTYLLNQPFGKIINLTYISIADMRDLPFKLKNQYLSHLNQDTTYIIYDIALCESGGEERTHFKTTDFLLGDTKRIKVTEEFFGEHIFFVVNREVKQYVKTPYNGRVQNYIREVNSRYRYRRIWRVVAAYMEYRHSLLFADCESLTNKDKRKVLIGALCGDGQAQYEYGRQFETANNILYFLWMKEAMKNGCKKAYYMNCRTITHSDFDVRTINRYYEEMLEYGFPDAARKLYEYEIKKENPNAEKIKEYTEKGFAVGGLMDCYRYAMVRSFILGRFDSIFNHEEALKGFEKFFELYDKTADSNYDKSLLSSVIFKMYYAYACELDFGGEDALDYMKSFKYYKKALKDSEMLDEYILDIGKQFCEGKYFKPNIEHGIKLIGMLAEKNSTSAQEYIAALGNTLMKNRRYSAAEKCYKICCGFDRRYCDKYIIAKMYRELEERGNLK